MIIRVFAGNLIKTTSSTISPDCDNEFNVSVDGGGSCCVECDVDFELEQEEFRSEEFVWHPARKF